MAADSSQLFGRLNVREIDGPRVFDHDRVFDIEAARQSAGLNDAIDLFRNADIRNRNGGRVVWVGVSVQIDVGEVGWVIRNIDDRVSTGVFGRNGGLIQERCCRCAAMVRIDIHGKRDLYRFTSAQRATGEHVDRGICLPSGVQSGRRAGDDSERVDRDGSGAEPRAAQISGSRHVVEQNQIREQRAAGIGVGQSIGDIPSSIRLFDGSTENRLVEV